MAPRYAAAYLRRSSVSVDSPGDASREAQEAAVRFLCGDSVTMFVDWGISGRTADRPDYQKLKVAIAADEVASVCAYSLSRLGRNARELLDFVELCQAHGVTVRTKVEGLETSSAFGRAMLTVMAAFAQLELEQGQERSAAAREARRTRAHEAGVELLGSQAPYGFQHVKGPDGVYRREPNPDEPLGPVLAAYRDAGSVLGACRLLESRGIPAPRGGTRWATSALTRIIERAAPDLLPRRSRTGRRTPAKALLAQLIECPFCGRTMTPNVHRGQLYCANGPRKRATHPRYVVREIDVLPFVQAKAGHLQFPGRRVARDGTEARREAIDLRLARAKEFYLEQKLTREQYDAEEAKARRELDALEARAAIAALPPVINWTWPTDKLNSVLRALFARVYLDQNMKPVRAEPLVPEWMTA
jgi:DNA invertase Pin-like site-specific DNA recombinase